MGRSLREADADDEALLLAVPADFRFERLGAIESSGVWEENETPR